MNKNYQLYNMNCLEAMKNIPDDSIDLVLTDPPYNLGLFMKNRATNLKAMRENFFGAAGWDDLEFDEWEKDMDEMFSELARIIKTRGSVIMFMSIIKVESIIRLAEKHGFYYKTTGIWHKKNPMPRNMNLHFINSTEAWIYFTYKSHGILRYLSLDCPNNDIGDFLSEVMMHFGIDINYNTARDRLEGGNPRKPQLRVKDVEWYMANMGYISPAKFRRMTEVYSVKFGRANASTDYGFLMGLKYLRG